MGLLPSGTALNVGLVIYGSLDIVTGGFIYDRRLVEHLRRKGHRVKVFALPWRDYARHLKDNFSSRFLRSLVSAPIDVLLQDELNHPSLFLMNARLKGRVRYPIVSIVHHLRCSELRPSWQNRLYRFVERRYLSTIDGFVFNSRTTRSTVEDLGIEGRPGVVAYPGGDAVCPTLSREDIERRSAESGPLRILFVGSLIPRKNLHTLISALGILNTDSWTLDVVGSLDTDLQYVRQVKETIARRNVGDKVRLCGTLTGNDLTALYARSHILAVPSSYEGFGMVYIEGMGFGLPALASTTGAASEIVTNGETGFLVDSLDTVSMARHIRHLSTDKAELTRMSLAALKRYAAHPTWEESAQAVLEFLEEIVKK